MLRRVECEREVKIVQKGFRGLKVWQSAYNLALTVYKTTKSFPREEKYGLVFQMQRASVSVSANIAEGYER
jgi:hypothetical protein